MMLRTLLYLLISVAIIPYTMRLPGINAQNHFFVVNLGIYSLFTLVFIAAMVFKKFRPAGIPGLIPYFIILTYSLASVFFIHGVSWLSPPVNEQLWILRFWLFDPLVVYITIFLALESEKTADRAIFYLVVLLGVLNVISIVNIPLKYELFYTIDTGMYNTRFSGIIGNSNQNAYLFCTLMPITYWLYKKADRTLPKLLYLGSIFFYAIGILLTGSRGGVCAFLVVCFGLAVVYKEYVKLLMALAMVVAVGLLLIYFENSFTLHAIERISLLQSKNLSDVTAGRNLIWGALSMLFFKQIATQILGYGVGTSSTLLQASGINASAHNWYIRIIIEFGILGALCWLNLFISIIRKITSKIRHNTIAQITLICLVSVLLSAFFSDLGLLLNINSMVFALLFYKLLRAGKEQAA